MAQVTLPYTLTAGTPENVNNLMSNLTALRDGVNTIDTAQIANGAVTAAKLASGVGGAADGSITDAKLAAALADNLGITNGSNTRRGSVSAATERTTTSTTPVDITGASISLTVASGSITVVGLVGSVKSAATAGVTSLSIAVGSGPVDIMGSTASPVTVNMRKGPDYQVAYAYTVCGSNASGTGTQTVKASFKTDGSSYTASVKDVFMYAINLDV